MANTVSKREHAEDPFHAHVMSRRQLVSVPTEAPIMRTAVKQQLLCDHRLAAFQLLATLGMSSARKIIVHGGGFMASPP